MSQRKKRAIELHKKGYNCAQAVSCTFEDKVDISEKELFRMAEGFGLGMGTMETCGAVTAMAILAGIVNSDGNLAEPKTKKETYGLIKEMTNQFLEKNQSVVCREIKGIKTGKVLRSCSGCIEDGVDILEKNLFK